MPTNSKTEKIGLNAWVESDKPKRSDFVSDNQLIDSVLGGHLEDTAMHLSTVQINKLNAPFVTGAYMGDGTSQSFFQLDFNPSLVLFAQQNNALVKQSGSDTIVTSGVATITSTSGGIMINGNKIYLTQSTETQTNGIRYSLNAASTNYLYIAFK